MRTLAPPLQAQQPSPSDIRIPVSVFTSSLSLHSHRRIQGRREKVARRILAARCRGRVASKVEGQPGHWRFHRRRRPQRPQGKPIRGRFLIPSRTMLTCPLLGLMIYSSPSTRSRWYRQPHRAEASRSTCSSRKSSWRSSSRTRSPSRKASSTASRSASAWAATFCPVSSMSRWSSALASRVSGLSSCLSTGVAR